MKTHLFFLLTIFCFCSAYGQYDSLKPQGIYTSSFIINETPRNLTYYMPLNYGKFDTYPLFIVLHDDNSNAMNTIKKYSDILHGKADSANCVVMYPDALQGHWALEKDSTNDVAFISIMLNFFIQQYHCDPDKIYLLGIGAGGNAALRFHCESSIKISGIATINATMKADDFQNCHKSNDIPNLTMKSEASLKPNIDKAFTFFLHPVAQ